MSNPPDMPAGSYALHPGCDVQVESMQEVLAESIKSAGHYVAPGVDTEPWNARTIPVAYDITYQPCGHTIRHYVGSADPILEVHTPEVTP